MLELVPCLACSRHVSVRETACPFCGSKLPPQRARFIVPRGFTRAAVFSAALVSCTSAKDDAAKPAGSAVQQGSDDLEKMLDPSSGPGGGERRAVVADAAIADGESIDAAIDAGVDAAPADAGVDPEVLKKRREAERKRREAERMRREIERQLEPVPDLPREHQIPKPYGAPPARRRVV